MGNRASVRESSQRIKTERRSDSMRRECVQSAQRPAASRGAEGFSPFFMEQPSRSTKSRNWQKQFSTACWEQAFCRHQRKSLPFAAGTARTDRRRESDQQRTYSASRRFLCEIGFGCGKPVAIPGDPNVQSRQHEDAQKQSPNESADNDNSKGPLRVRTDAA